MENRTTQNVFTPKEIASFVGFGESLRKVYARLLAEGYRLENGELIKPQPTASQTEQVHL